MKRKAVLHFSLFCIVLTTLMVSTSCTTKKEVLPGKQNLSFFALQDTIQNIIQTTASWEAVDKLYRSTPSTERSGDLLNHTIFWMTVSTTHFFEEADRKTIEYYLHEAEQIDFNINLRLLVKMLIQVEPFWTKSRLADYALQVYQKNTMYWTTHFPGQTIYLEKNKDALAELEMLSKIK